MPVATLGAAFLSVEGRACRFPIPAVEAADIDPERAGIVERVEIDAPGGGVRARLVEAFDSADPAEEMLGGAGAEAVAGQRVAARHESEILVRDDQVAKARHRADRA